MRRRDLIAFVGAASALASFAAAQHHRRSCCRISRLGALLASLSAGYARARDQPEDGEGARCVYRKLKLGRSDDKVRQGSDLR